MPIHWLTCKALVTTSILVTTSKALVTSSDALVPINSAQPHVTRLRSPAAVVAGEALVIRPVRGGGQNDDKTKQV